MRPRYLILALFFILIFRLFSIPLFEPPDEQYHYAQIHYYATEGSMPERNDLFTISQEEFELQKTLGTLNGIENKHYFHPEYRYEASHGLYGKYEEAISSLNTVEHRETYVAAGSSTYPPLYYWLGSLFYRLTYSQDIFTRIFSSRIVSLLATLLIPILAYYFGRYTTSSESFSRTLLALTVFFPMTTALGVGVNSDNLHFLWFGLIFLLLAIMLKKGTGYYLSLALGLVVAIDLLTRPQAYIALPIILFAYLLCFQSKNWKFWIKNVTLFSITFLVLSAWHELPKFFSERNDYLVTVINYGGMDHFMSFFRDYLRLHTSEIIVWYWGVFKYLGLILPKPFWWLANRLVLLAVLGIFIQFYRDLRVKKFSLLSRSNVLSIFAMVMYVSSILYYDWKYYQEFGASLGLQGRYYVPILIPTLFILASGLCSLFSILINKRFIFLFLTTFFLAMHLSSVYTQLGGYYDLWPIPGFVDQLSQYKPTLGKGLWWFLWFPLYFTGLSYILIWVFKANDKQKVGQL
jgi:4-amino-4-deoxy-L-arabinose transferase-like glycosyltransferase